MNLEVLILASAKLWLLAGLVSKRKVGLNVIENLCFIISDLYAHSLSKTNKPCMLQKNIFYVKMKKISKKLMISVNHLKYIFLNMKHFNA